MEKKLIYLDNAATTPIHPEVIDAMIPYLSTHFGNPSSQYSLGRNTRSAIEGARKRIAKILNCSPAELFFTSGGTESNNTAIKGAVRDLGVKRIISSPIEHHCGLHTFDALEKEGIEIVYLNIDNQGKIDYNELTRLLSDLEKKTLVSLMHANNEIGVLLDINRVGKICKQYSAFFHCDTVPTFGHLPLDLKSIEVDFISAAAHKFHGPKGIGLLFVRKGIPLKSFMHGGGQERNFRAGTENVYGIVGLAKAFELANDNLMEDIKKVSHLKSYFKEKITASIPDISYNGPIDEHSIYTILNVSFPNVGEAPLLLFSLDLEGICVSGGSACSSGANAGSHVLNALNVPSDRVNIRFSFSKFNTIEELDIVLEKLKTTFSS